MSEKSSSCYTASINASQAAELRERLEKRGWSFASAPYARYRASGEGVSLTVYESGKLVVQGRGMADFITFTLEPEILHTFGFGYENSSAGKTAEAEPEPEPITPHGGIDESGKGDFFGPLAVAGVVVDAASGAKLRRLGVCDSKLISGSVKIHRLAAEIRKIAAGRFSVLVLKPETYNRLYSRIGNLNSLLAWGHARTIENLLELVPDCPRMLSDKFGDERLIRRALMTRGRGIILEQRVRAESDVAVAAASILARDAFLRGMAALSEAVGMELPRGAGAGVRETGMKLLEKHGAEIFSGCAKTHFRTFSEIAATAGTEKPADPPHPEN